ncbi:MAG TPA: hypothetical protein PKM48_02805 [Parvularculaceae bacterium]|nr:hypothetical protein [Parvularculaceae bacterium]HNS87186.1 hypothetical protein [Parvularculaceae bacterium]
MTFGKRGDAIVCTHLGRPGATVNEVIFTQVDGVYQFLCGERTHQESDGYPVQSAEFFRRLPELGFFRAIGQSFIARRLDAPDGWEIRFVDADAL